MTRRFIIVVLLSFAVDLAISGYVVAMQYQLWTLACVTTAMIPFGSFAFNQWFIDDKVFRNRLILTVANALGGLLAQAVVIPIALRLEHM